jgi:hypothetical protein
LAGGTLEQGVVRAPPHSRVERSEGVAGRIRNRARSEAFSTGRKGNEMSERSNVSTEEHKVKGEALLGKVREIVHEGNVRRIIIKDEEGKNLIEIPLTVGVVGVWSPRSQPPSGP